MQRLLGSLAVFVLILAASGCSIPKEVIAPTVELQNVRILKAKGLMQMIQVDLLVSNPNNFDIPLTGMDFVMKVNGAVFAQGLSNKPVTIPRLGRATVPVQVNIAMLTVFTHIRAIQKKRKLAYHLTGTAYLDHLIMPKVSFEKSGDLDLPRDNKGLRFQPQAS